ncbi:hypothetical protein [uncultured Tateyamaria sp.]|nr:hypothetical protein [uncultured Tateyamaria sp.]
MPPFMLFFRLDEINPVSQRVPLYKSSTFNAPSFGIRVTPPEP